MVKIAIIGAGVIGLTSAYSTKLIDSSLDVTVFAERFTLDTTSDGAAGIFAVTEGPKGMRNTRPDLLRRWALDSYNWYKRNCNMEMAPTMGISSISGYWLSDKDSIDAKVWLSIVDSHQLTAKQLADFGPDIKSGVFGTTFVCECRRYLPWLMERFGELNGKIVQTKIKSLHELSAYDIIINCSGLGAIELCKDEWLEPCRGQIARIEAPWIRHFYHIENSNAKKPHVAYIYPNISNVVIGGTSDIGNDLAVSKETHDLIVERAAKIVPSIEGAALVRDWVGLRPSRTAVRLEREDVVLKSEAEKLEKTVRVIHNYGHGPCGVSLSWGCAQHTVELVKSCLEEIGCKSKL